MRYEDSIDGGYTGQKNPQIAGGLNSTRVAREARSAEIDSTRLVAGGTIDAAPATLLAERDRRKRRIRKRLAFVAAFLATLLLGAVGAGAWFYWSMHNRMVVPTHETPQALANTPTPEPTEPFNLVIFGSDARSPDSNDLTDTIIVTRVDPVEKAMWMVSIPRDTRVELPGQPAKKINAAYAIGGTDLAIQAVEKVSGQEIDYFMTINFWGFRDIVDSMGGIEIDVPIAINDTEADATPDNRASRIAPGLQELDGDHALTFVRHRSGYVDGDIGRTRAQQMFFRAVIEQMGDVPMTRLPGIANSLADNVRTNFTPMQLMQLGREMRGIDTEHFYSTTLPGEWRSPFIHINESEAAVVWSKFGVEPFDSPEGDGETESPSIDPAEVTLTVRNGTTRVGIAREASAIMRARGFVVEDVGNTANQAVYDENMVVFRENRAKAELVARFMPPETTRVVESRGMFRFDTDVLVILGTDWDIAQVPVADITAE